jgi:hypothetical protein
MLSGGGGQYWFSGHALSNAAEFAESNPHPSTINSRSLATIRSETGMNT